MCGEVSGKDTEMGIGMLTVSHISKKRKQFELRDVSFEVPAGYITGLAGKNGAGKSTLIQLILGQLCADAGEICLGELKGSRDASLLRDQTGFVLEKENLFLRGKTAYENGDFFGRFYTKWDSALYRKYLADFGLSVTEQKRLPVGSLSIGQYIRFQLAFALAHHPELLLLDEPTANLDPVFRMKFLTLLQEAVEREEMAVLFATHITTDLDKIGDYLVVLDEGSVVCMGSKEELFDMYQTKRVSEIILKGCGKHDTK